MTLSQIISGFLRENPIPLELERSYSYLVAKLIVPISSQEQREEIPQVKKRLIKLIRVEDDYDKLVNLLGAPLDSHKDLLNVVRIRMIELNSEHFSEIKDFKKLQTRWRNTPVILVAGNQPKQQLEDIIFQLLKEINQANIFEFKSFLDFIEDKTNSIEDVLPEFRDEFKKTLKRLQEK